MESRRMQDLVLAKTYESRLLLGAEATRAKRLGGDSPSSRDHPEPEDSGPGRDRFRLAGVRAAAP
jgi:hypothetical protein